MTKKIDWKARAQAADADVLFLKRQLSESRDALGAANMREKNADKKLLSVVDERDDAIEQKRIAFDALLQALALAELNATKYRRELHATTCLIHDLQLVTAGGAQMLCGCKWIRGEQLLEALRRYSEK